MRTRPRYRETSLIERIAAPITRIIIAADACLVRLCMKILSDSSRFVEKEAISGAMFILSALAGIAFVFGVASQRPELHYTQNDTLKTCVAIFSTVIILRIICGRSARKIKNFSSKVQKKEMEILQPFRTSTMFFLSAIAALGLIQTGRYYSGQWYFDGYFYLAVSAFLSTVGVYTHSALVYLNMREKMSEEKDARIKEFTGAKV